MENWTVALVDQLKESLLPLAFVLAGILLLGFLGKTLPTGRTLVLAFGSVILAAAGHYWPWASLVTWLFVPLLVILLMVDAFLLSVSARRIDLSRSLNRKLSIGQQNPVQLTIVNNSSAPLSGLLCDSVPPGLLSGENAAMRTLPVQLVPYGQQDVSYQLFPIRRGRYGFGRIHFRYRSRLGLLWLTMQGGRAENIQVMPDLRRIKRMRIFASRAHSVGELQKKALGLEGTQFSGLRHYFAGDDIRKMAWQATARLDIPVVRTFEPEVEQPILVLLDAGRKMETSIRHLRKFDWALNTALAFMGVAIDRRDCVGVGVFSNRILADIPVGLGRAHLNHILNVLSEIEVEPVEPEYESVMLQFARALKRRSLVVVFTDLIDPVASRSLVHALRSFSSQHLLMVVTFADRDALSLGNQLPESPYEAYCKGVSLDLLALRRQTLQKLVQGNRAVVVDAPPEALDENLIRQYLQLKRQGRL
jgi:uncharacterized protein (DUF58 family)